MSQNETIFLQLRYLQTLNSISAENNSTIVFPVPIDIISTMMGNMATVRYMIDSIKGKDMQWKIKNCQE